MNLTIVVEYRMSTVILMGIYFGLVISLHALLRGFVSRDSGVAIVYGLAGLVFVGFTAGMVPPFLNHLIPIVIGILLLLRRYQAPIVKHQEAEPIVAAARR
jgi:hypothetical protein